MKRMMKKSSGKILMCILLITICSALRNSSAQNDSAYSTEKHFYKANSDSINETSRLQKKNTRKILTDLFDSYLQIKNSLSVNDSLSAQMNALQFLDKIQSLYDKTDKRYIPDDWKLFSQYAPGARSDIASSTSLSRQRYLFGVMSSYLIEFIRVYGLNNKTLYILQCRNTYMPGSGKWLSDLNDGKNPFLGPGNENCIEVIETKMF